MQSFEIGRTLSRAFGLVGKTLASVGLFLLVIQAVSALLQIALQGELLANVEQMAQNEDPNAAMGIFQSGWYWGSLLLSLALSAISFGGCMYGMLKAAANQTPSLAGCFNAGMSKMLPVFALTLLWGIGVGVGSMLLFVPGLILMCMWSAALPALIGEQTSVTAAFGRSRALTRGSRLKIFVVLFILLVLIYVFMFGLIAAVLGAGMLGGSIPLAGSGSPLFALFAVPVGWFLASVLNATLVSIYLETIEIKEGGTHGHLVEVFE